MAHHMKIELANHVDVTLAENGHISPEDIRRFNVEGMVDAGTVHLVIPAAAMQSLGLQESWQSKVKYADGHTSSRPVVKNVWLKLCDRDAVFSAIVEQNRETVLIGTIVLESLDLVVDRITQTLYPRHPHYMLIQVE